ncbi:alpha/beta hydrolase fold domain-containing protein [Aliiruegeria haliotis]|uniref:alpha/beta hydrolase fold domain-containing protein n=1 Tax=Aliiruegeria haliotis TaxID=1280846 RepID=UPI002481D1E1|nr:alpha/beta hydrolase fold domain-containing protein [Aliiruegeria haliotis]
MSEAATFALGAFDPRDPRVSPLFASFRDPPPVALHVRTTELFRDDARRVAEVLRNAGGRSR